MMLCVIMCLVLVVMVMVRMIINEVGIMERLVVIV